jgi:hypothetical protein
MRTDLNWILLNIKINKMENNKFSTRKINTVSKGPNSQESFFKKYGVIILIILIILLLISNAFLFKFYLENSQKIVINDQEKNLIEMSKMQLAVEYYRTLDSLNLYKSDNKALNDVIDNQKKKLDETYQNLQNKIELGMNTATLAEEIRKFKLQANAYSSELEVLKKDNEKLKQKLNQISQEKQREESLHTETKKQLESAQDTIGLTQKEKEQLRQKLEEEYRTSEELKKKLAAEKYLHINDVLIYTRCDKALGKGTKSTDKAKKVDYIDICFNVDANRLIEIGNQAFYFRLISELGAPIEIGNESPTINGREARFANKQMIAYSGNSEQKCISLKPRFSLNRGKYTLEIINNNVVVGTQNLELK